MAEALPVIRKIVVYLSGLLGTVAVADAFPKYTPLLTALTTLLGFIANSLPRAETKAVKELKEDVSLIKQEGTAPSAEAGLKIRESLAAAAQTYGPEGAQ